MFCVFWWRPRLKHWLERRLGETVTVGSSGNWKIERGVGAARDRHGTARWLWLELLVTGTELGFVLAMALSWGGVALGGWLLLRAITGSD